MNQVRKHCYLCRWWWSHEDILGKGSCHRYPPQFIDGEGRQHSESEGWMHPVTDSLDWCAEWEEANDPVADAPLLSEPGKLAQRYFARHEEESEKMRKLLLRSRPALAAGGEETDSQSMHR